MLLAACWAGGDRAVASHRAAAALWRLPGGDDGVIEVTCPRWRRSRHDGLVVHESTRLDEVDVTEVDRIPCTSLERTIFDMCGTGGAALADLLLDSALRRRLTTLPRLIATRDRLAKRGRRGAAGFRSAVDSRDPSMAPAESEPERMLARFLVKNGLPTPVHQFVVRDRDHCFVARVDLAYPDAGVVIEYDSAEYHVGKVALERDSARRNAMVSLGIFVVTATSADLRDRARALSAQIEPLLRQGTRP
jgi:very-short-patch-repair endonuclease